MGITAEGNLAIGHVAKGGAEDDDDAGKTREADEGEADVRAREEVPGFHLFFVTEVSMACQGAERKCGLPPVLFEVGYCFLDNLCAVFEMT